MEKIKMHKKMAMTGKSPVGYSKGGMSKEDITREGKRGIAAGKAVGESLRDKNAPMKRQRLEDRQPSKKMGGGMMKPTGYKMGGGVKKPVTVKEITPKGRKGVLIYKGKAKDYKPVGKNK